VLVDGIVGEMHVPTLLGLSVLMLIIVILTSCEPSQTFIIDVDPQRVEGSDCNINSQIELVSINQQRLVQVF